MKLKKILLHRFMSIEKLIDLIENGHLVLIKPQKWLDPLENIISKVKFKKDGEVSYIDYLNNVYGICFGKAKESNLMWDSYTPNGSGVRITFDKNLLKSRILRNEYNPRNYHFKYVNYVRYDEIMSQLQDRKMLIEYFNNPNKKLIKYLFYKRNAYRYEEEYRIIYDANDDEDEYGDFIYMKIDPQKLIEKIFFNPKMANSDCTAITKYLIRQGIKKNKIFRSLLYKKKIRTTINLR